MRAIVRLGPLDHQGDMLQDFKKGMKLNFIVSASPKVKALITHAGFNSLTESTYYGVPLVMLPFFGDQYGNVKRVERLNVGVALDKANITEENVFQALKTVLQDKT